MSEPARIVPALDVESLIPSVHRTIAESKRADGDELGALAHLIAAQTLDSETSAIELCNVATGYFMKGDAETAAGWYRLVLKIDPSLAVAYQNLAAIYDNAGSTLPSEWCRQRAYQIQRVFVDHVGDLGRRVLVLCAGRASGNVPYKILLPTTTCCRIQYAIDYGEMAEDERLPPFDLVFNAIGEPDIAEPIADRLETFARRCGRPLLNSPASVARTRRDRMADLLAGLDDVVVAPCQRFDGAPASHAALHDFAFPVLARPTASHGGEGLVRCDTIDALEDWFKNEAGAYYLTTFRDCRDADGYFRKYRVIFVDRAPFPYHLAISPHWMVHYFSADMEGNAWKLDEERRFLQDPQAELGVRAMAAVAAIGRRLDLDYGGIDFTLLPDGKVFVFEANATMRVHEERSDGALSHKNTYVQRIVDAFEQLLVRRGAPS